MFIVLEGIDGCGKSTQAKLLADWFTEQRKEIVLTAEPTKEGDIGKFIREILSSKKQITPEALALLFVADRKEHLNNCIEPLLSEGKVVISERYSLSTIAYQSAQGVDTDWLIDLHKYIRKPDLIIFLDVSPENAEVNIRKKLEQKEEQLKARIKELVGFRREANTRLNGAWSKNFDLLIREEDRKKWGGQTTKSPLDDYEKQRFIAEIEKAHNELEKINKDTIYERRKYLLFKEFEKPVVFGGEKTEHRIFLEKVRENFLKYRNEFVVKDEIEIVNGNRSKEEVFGDIKRVIRHKIQ